MDLTHEPPHHEIPTASRHRVKVKAPKSGSDRLELVLDDDRDDDNNNNHKSNNYYGINNTDDECRQTCKPRPDNDDNPYFFDDKFPESLYKECTSSHSASTTETDNRASARSSSSAGSSLGRTWSIESGGVDEGEEDDYYDDGKANNTADKYSGSEDKYGGCDGSVSDGREHELHPTGAEHHIFEAAADPVANHEFDSGIDRKDHFQGIYQIQQRQREQYEKIESYTQVDDAGANVLYRDADPTSSSSANHGDNDHCIAAERPVHISSRNTGSDFQISSSDAIVNNEVSVKKHNPQPVKRSDSMAHSEDTSVESMGWKVTSNLKQETLPSSKSMEGYSECNSNNEIKGVLRVETRYSPRNRSGSNSATDTNGHATDSSRVARSSSSSSSGSGSGSGSGSTDNDVECIGNTGDDDGPHTVSLAYDVDNTENSVSTPKPEFCSSSKATALRHYEKDQRRNQSKTQKASTLRQSSPRHDVLKHRQQRRHQSPSHHQYQYMPPQQQHQQHHGRRSSSSGAVVSSSSRSIATGRSDAAVSPSPLINHRRHRREERKVRWQHSRNRSDREALVDGQTEDYPQFPVIPPSHSNVSSRSAATSAYSNAALDGYVDPEEGRRTHTGMGTRFVSSARTCRRNVMNLMGNAILRRRKSSSKKKKKEKEIGENDNDEPRRQRMPPPEMTQQSNRYYKTQSTSRPKTEYHFEGYDHLKSSVRAKSHRPSSRNRNEDNATPTTEHHLLGTVNDENRADDNPWAHISGGDVSGEHDNATPYSTKFNGDNEPNLFMPNNDELPPPAGEVNMTGLGMPAIKWWTWKQNEEPHQEPRGMQGPGQGQDGDCTYFAFMCMFPTAETSAARHR